MKRKWTSSFPVAAIVIASLGAGAELAVADDDTGFYVGANAVSLLSTYRRSDLNNATNAAFGGEDAGFSLGPTAVQRNHLMWAVDVGYMATRNFGLEASFIDLGTLHYSAFGTQAAFDGSTGAQNLDLNFRTHGPALALVGVLPMTNVWDIEARAGAYEAKTITTFATSGSDPGQSGKFSKTSTGLLASVGTAFNISSRFVLRVDYLRLQHIREEALERSFNVDAVTAGVAFVF